VRPFGPFKKKGEKGEIGLGKLLRRKVGEKKRGGDGFDRCGLSGKTERRQMLKKKKKGKEKEQQILLSWMKKKGSRSLYENERPSGEKPETKRCSEGKEGLVDTCLAR